MRSLRPAPVSGARRPAAPSHERIQREHELNRALEAARALQARLEMLGDWPDDVRCVRALRDRLAERLTKLGAFRKVKRDKAIVGVPQNLEQKIVLAEDPA